VFVDETPVDAERETVLLGRAQSEPATYDRALGRRPSPETSSVEQEPASMSCAARAALRTKRWRAARVWSQVL
jgi:hypothetical protein